MNETVFLKLGGSLITQKNKVKTPRRKVISRLMQEIAGVYTSNPKMRLILAHGSGSFGHTEANKYKTRDGVSGQRNWEGFAEVQKAAGLLNRLILDSAWKAALPVVNFPPSASVVCRKGDIRRLAVTPIHVTLENRLIPLVFGDVAVDEVWGGTIVSTEQVFLFLAKHLEPNRVLLAGNEKGVLSSWPAGKIIKRITKQSDLSGVKKADTVDVTGGMATKVQNMLKLARVSKGCSVHIFSGNVPGLLGNALTGGDTKGTLIQYK